MSEEKSHNSGESIGLLSYKIDELRSEVAALKGLQERLVSTVNRIEIDNSNRISRLESMVGNAKTVVFILIPVVGLFLTSLGIVAAFLKLKT